MTGECNLPEPAIMSSFEDLLNAVDWVSISAAGQNAAYVNRTTGQVYWVGDAIDDDVELPDDLEDGSQYIAVPDKRDLDLGRPLVFQFAREHLSAGDLDKVFAMFKRPGAYARFKDLLERRDQLQAWYTYEAQAMHSALAEWVRDNALPITLPNAPPT